MYRYKQRIKALEKKIAKNSPHIFLGKLGEYALVSGQRIDWEKFIKLFPRYTLVSDEKPKGIEADETVKK